MEIGEAIKNPAYRILQTEYSGCLVISAHAQRHAGNRDLLCQTLQFVRPEQLKGNLISRDYFDATASN